MFITFRHLYGLGDLQNYGFPKFVNKSESHISNTSLCMIIYYKNSSTFFLHYFRLVFLFQLYKCALGAPSLTMDDFS